MTGITRQLSAASTSHSVNACAASSARCDLAIIKSEALILAGRGELAPSLEERIARLSEQLSNLETSIANQGGQLATLFNTAGE